MAIYHCSAQLISRSNGRSATGAAAYRGGVEIADERTGLVHDYTRKRGVDYTTIVAPDHAPDWVHDRAQLWNRVEQAEKRKDAQLCREVEVALPRELNLTQMQALVTGFARSQFVAKGMVADIAIHHAKSGNPHPHILLTTRDISSQGFNQKNRDWNRKELLREWRQEWAQHANRALELAGHEQRIDHRTLEAQGVDRDPTHHLGPAATEYERRTGAPSRRRTELEADPQATREIAEIDQALSTTTRDLRIAQIFVNNLKQTRQDQTRALAEMRAEAKRQRERQTQQKHDSVMSPVCPEREPSQRPASPARTEQEHPATQPRSANPEQARIERMTAQELAAEIKRLTPSPVEEVLHQRWEVTKPLDQAEQARRQAERAHQTAEQARQEMAQWRKAHPVRARLHDAGVAQEYLTQREQTEREQTQREQALARTKRLADQQARYVADYLRSTITAEQAPIWARIAELETLRQAKMAQEQAQERQEATLERFQTVQRHQVAPERQERPQATLERLQAVQRHQVAPERQERPQAAIERLQAVQRHHVGSEPQERRRPAPERLKVVSERQERPQDPQQERAQQLREAFETLDKRTAMQRFPELARLYPIMAEAARFAQEKLHEANRAAFVEGIKERGIQALAQGETLPELPKSPALQPQREIEREQEQDFDLEP